MSNRGESNQLAKRLFKEIMGLQAEINKPQSDDRMNEACAELLEATTALANAPALDITDLQSKMTVLCQRLRYQIHFEDKGTVVSALLAESIRDDLALL